MVAAQHGGGPSNDAASPPVSDERPRLTQDYSARFRDECAKVLHRLCPEGGNDSLPDWNEADVLQLNTIFQVARVARVAGSKWLEGSTILRVLEKLTTSSFFKAHRGPEDLVDMERHFRLLSAVLCLYKYENVSLNHHLRLKLLNGIQQLADSFEANRRNCSPDKQIENWNVAFLIHRCQSLMSSINDVDTLTTALARRATGVMDGALSGYGGQWVDARMYLREITRIQRPAPKWHAEFVKLEDLCFSLFAGGYKVWDGESTGENTSASSEDEREITDRLCNVLEETLVEGDVGEFYTLLRTLRSGFGKATRLLFDSGVYEENSEYFHYGIMDLMMQMTYHVKDRGYCFKEFVRIVRTTLERSHTKANSLHRKAIDLYRKIISEGDHDKVRYGQDEDVAAIRTWIDANRDHIEIRDASYRYVTLLFIINVQPSAEKHD